MTQSLCLNCGRLKIGAFNQCPECGVEPIDCEIALQFTSHSLSADELESIGRVVKRLRDLEPDPEVRFHALMYFVSRKWPKILEFDIDEVEPTLADRIDEVYQRHLSETPGQRTHKRLERPPWSGDRWLRADPDMQADDDCWGEGVQAKLLEGLAVAEDVVGLMIESGEGAVLQRVAHRLRRVFSNVDWELLAGRARDLVHAAEQHERSVARHAGRVKNGWSGRTKRRAQYLRGCGVRLLEMARLCERIVRHKEGTMELIPLEFGRAKEEFRFAYDMYIRLIGVVSRPDTIVQRDSDS